MGDRELFQVTVMKAVLSLRASARLIVDYFLGGRGGFNYVLTCLLLAVHDCVNTSNKTSGKSIKLARKYRKSQSTLMQWISQHKVVKWIGTS